MDEDETIDVDPDAPGLWDGCRAPSLASVYHRDDVTPGETLAYDCGECDWCRMWGDEYFFSPEWHRRRREEEMYETEI